MKFDVIDEIQLTILLLSQTYWNKAGWWGGRGKRGGGGEALLTALKKPLMFACVQTFMNRFDSNFAASRWHITVENPTDMIS